MPINHRYDSQVRQFFTAPEFRVTQSTIGDLIYGLGRLLTKPFAWEASLATKLFGPHKRPGKIPSSFTPVKTAYRSAALVLGLVPSLALAALGYPIKLLGSLFKGSMALIENKQAKKEYNKAEGLHLMTYNVGLMPTVIRNVNDLRSTPRRAEGIAQVLSEAQSDEQPDVVCFQEVFDIDATGDLAEGIKKNYHHILHSVAPRETGLSSGLMIANKFPIIEAHYRPYLNLAAEDALSNKGLLRVVLDLGGGKTAVVYNTHLQAKEEPYYAEIRQKQLTQIREWMEEDKQKDQRAHVGIFLLGDLNVSHRYDTGAPSKEYDVAIATLSKAFENPFYKDHNPVDEKRTQSQPRFLPPGIEEPTGSWYEGANPQRGQSRAAWGQETWHKTRKTMDRCIYDHQFIYDPNQQDRFATHAEIRQLLKGTTPSGLSDHLPVSVIYKEKP